MVPNITSFLPIDDGEQWPPRDPTAIRQDGPEAEFQLPPSPWTYENGSLNPSLQPSSAGLRKTRRSKIMSKGASALPPYHPDYREGEYTPDPQDLPDNNDSSEDDDYTGRVRVRRGSEGYEVLPQGRDDMLRRYLEEMGEEDHSKYVRYIPEVGSDTEEEDDVPLAKVIGTRN